VAGLAACLDPSVEQIGLLADGSKSKPADVSTNNEYGKKTFVDVSIASVMQNSKLENACTISGYIASLSEDMKIQKYFEPAAKVGQSFCPFIWENFGRRGIRCERLIRWITNRVASKSGSSYSRTKAFFNAQCSVTLMRSQARTLIHHRYRRILVSDPAFPPFSNPFEDLNLDF
jgi:hypothetical protein